MAQSVSIDPQRENPIKSSSHDGRNTIRKSICCLNNEKDLGARNRAGAYYSMNHVWSGNAMNACMYSVSEKPRRVLVV